MSRQYVASKRNDYIGNDYIGVEEVEDGKILCTVISGVKPLWLGRKIAELMNGAYWRGQQDAKERQSGQRDPLCCGREMLPVVSRRTSSNAMSREKDTPVWWCPDCHKQIKREEDKKGE